MPDSSDFPILDVALVGGGIMSATLGTFLRQLDPGLRIAAFERLDRVGAESSAAWNNAGTGHSGYCELNYTPRAADGSIDISKAERIAHQFELSRQFWSALTEAGIIRHPDRFIRPIPHMSLVMGERDMHFLKARQEAMVRSPFFREMEFTDDRRRLEEWIPLMMQGRDPGQVLAATRIDSGTDMNFGALTETLFFHLDGQPDFDLVLNAQVVRVERGRHAPWRLLVESRLTGREQWVHAKFLFLGAGGAALTLLEDCDVPEGQGYAGFPVSGQWLRCTNPEVIAQHHAKVYGKQAQGSPPMSMPHLDSRVIDGRRELLFGPYAGFNTKFLKHGSFLDLFESIDLHNLRPMLQAGLDNLNLTRYLLGQVLQDKEERLETLRQYYPGARAEDWTLQVAGQRVQIIKDVPGEGGKLEFGTEVVTAGDGTLAALLGASPGASTAVAIALEVLERCFAGRVATPEWRATLTRLVPTWADLDGFDPDEIRESRRRTSEVLGLHATEG
ncbi:MAG: malate dehydrogenase (quinone) [Planctomycetota bacterium]